MTCRHLGKSKPPFRTPSSSEKFSWKSKTLASMSEKFNNSTKNEVKSDWKIGERKGTDPCKNNKRNKVSNRGKFQTVIELKFLKVSFFNSFFEVLLKPHMRFGFREESRRRRRRGKSRFSVHRKYQRRWVKIPKVPSDSLERSARRRVFLCT